MGNTRRPVSRSELLQVAGIWIRPEGKGVVIEATVDGAARLARNLQRVSTGKGDTSFMSTFLEELISVGRYARRTSPSGHP